MKCSGLVFPIGLLLLPFVAAAAPTTQPAANVAIAPFSAIGDSASDWIGKAVQQNLIADLARVHFRPSESAVSEGYVISGSYQYADQMIRFTGQLAEAKSGKVVGGLSATGSVHDLFSLEDTLSNQAIGQLRQLTTTAAPTVTTRTPTIDDLVQPAVALDEPSVLYYADANQTPTNDFSDQYGASRDRQMYQYNNYYGYCYGPYWGWYAPFYPRFGFGFNGFYSGGTYTTTSTR